MRELLVQIPIVEGPLRQLALAAAERLRRISTMPVTLDPLLSGWRTASAATTAGSIAFLRPDAQPETPPGYPLVNISYYHHGIAYPRVGTDHAAIGVLAGNWLAQLPVDRWAVITHAIPEVAERCHHCALALEARGRTCARWPAEAMQDAEMLRPLVGDGRTAVYLASDRRAELLIKTARRIGLSIPDQLAVLATDDNDLVQSCVEIGLSTITVPTRGIGTAAADLLLAMVNGQPAPQRPVLLPPGRVIERASTRLPVADALVARALEIITADYRHQISVAAIAQRCGCSRRNLEERFRRQRGISLGDALAQLRLANACDLLEHTNDSIAAIASAVGFATASGLSRLFATHLGCPPSLYRQRFGGAVDAG